MEIKKIDLDEAPHSAQELKKPAFEVEESITKDPPMIKSNYLPLIILFIIAISAGILTGSWLKNRTAASSGSGVTSNIQAEIPASGVKVGDVYGSADEKTFRDKVLGVVDKGGINGEGTHKLLRPGGASQTVCLSSTTIDLDMLVGNQVTLWGETFKGQKCGWLMDVGRAKIENINVPLPTQ